MNERKGMLWTAEEIFALLVNQEKEFAGFLKRSKKWETNRLSLALLADDLERSDEAVISCLRKIEHWWTFYAKSDPKSNFERACHKAYELFRLYKQGEFCTCWGRGFCNGRKNTTDPDPKCPKCGGTGRINNLPKEKSRRSFTQLA